MLQLLKSQDLDKVHNDKNKILHYETGEIKSKTNYIGNIAIKTIEYFKSGKIYREIFYGKDSSSPLKYSMLTGVEYNEFGEIIGKLSFSSDTIMKKEGDYWIEYIKGVIVVDSIKK